MKRVALLAGVLAVAAVLFYALHGSSTSATKPTPTSTRAANGAQMAAHSAPSVTPTLDVKSDVGEPATVEHARVVGLPEPLEPGYLAVENAAKTCMRGRPAPTPIRPNGPDETIDSIQLSYRQVSDQGVGRVEDLKITEGKLTDQALQSCIVKVAAAVTWSSPAADGEIGTLQQNVNVGDLLRPDDRLPPESQRSPKPTAPPPIAQSGPLGKQAPEAEDDHPGVIVSDPSLAKQRK